MQIFLHYTREQNIYSIVSFYRNLLNNKMLLSESIQFPLKADGRIIFNTLIGQNTSLQFARWLV
jgi:hypothetical protein